MIIGERLRAWREYKAFSLGDMERRTGLLRYHVSRIENGHAIPTLETLAKFARAFDVPLFHLVYEEDGPYHPPILPQSIRSIENPAGLSKNELRFLERLNLLIMQLPECDRQLLFGLTRKMVNRMTHRAQARKRPNTGKRRRKGHNLRPKTTRTRR